MGGIYTCMVHSMGAHLQDTLRSLALVIDKWVRTSWCTAFPLAFGIKGLQCQAYSIVIL